ncbi:MAG: tyrosine-type recombinase/integrase [Proteobacteria bacterium]|nr:tyrosine-type recombinase/integrase [Pseudomonadota bacterium]
MDLEKFRQYLGVDTLEEALGNLIDSPHSQANLIVLHYKAVLHETGLKSSTINRRLSTLRSLIKSANRLGIVPWQLEVGNDRIEFSPNADGPGESDVKKMLHVSKNQTSSLKSARDYAILRLVHDLAFKRNSLVNLDTSDLSLKLGTLSITSPDGVSQRTMKLPKTTLQALKKWIEFRGREEGPLFTNFDHAGKGKRLTGTSIYRIIRKLGDDIGIRTGPQGIRNAAIAEVVKKADQVGIDLRDVTVFSDHKNVESLSNLRKKENSARKKLLKRIAN